LSAVIIAAALMLADNMVGKIGASTTRNASSPRTPG
jgi:hypothetical protein